MPASSPAAEAAPVPALAWLADLHPAVQSRICHGSNEPDALIPYIAHLSGEELRPILTDRAFPGLCVALEPGEARDREIARLVRLAAWHRETWAHGALPEELNDHAFVRHYGNKPVVVHWSAGGELVHQAIGDFKNSQIDRFMPAVDPKTGQLVRAPLATAWLTHPNTPRYDRVEFLPGDTDPPPGVLNLWRGWPCRDDVTDDSEGEPVWCQRFLAHMRENVCGGDHETYWYLLGWMADALQNPHRTSEVAVVLRGPQGSGKTLWAKLFMELFAPHTLTLDKPDHLTGSFNKHLQDKSIIFADEAFFAGNRQHAATLKTLITGDEIFVHPKGVDGFMAKKLFRLIIASNDEHVIRAEGDDRRYLVLNVDAGEHNQSAAYFGAIVDEWREGGRAALFQWLRGAYWRKMLDSGAWDVRDRPKTAALQAQKDMSLSPATRLVHNMLRDGEVPGLYGADEKRGFVFVATRALQEAGRLGEEHERGLGEALCVLAGAGVSSVRAYLGEGHARRQWRGYWLPPLDECRRRWEAHLGRKVEWPAGIATWGFEAQPPEPDDDLPF